jgi:CheY-like chemotaxis protein
MDVNIPVLYVEDDMLSRKVMELLLTRALGFKHVTIFENSVNFVQRLEAISPKPELVFLDIHMLPISGFEMLKLLRAHPAFKDTQVVALTASVMNEEVEQLRHAGFDGVIAKPIDQDTFSDTLTRILNRELVWNIL